MSDLNPIIVTTRRGDLVENRHRGVYAVVTATGELIAASGNFRQKFYPRSSIKPIQALAMLVSGAAEAFNVSDEELALACASHNGEADHVRIAQAWLERLGLTQADLVCGCHNPMGRDVAYGLIRNDQQPSPLHNACSGKHCGFLTLARHQGYPFAGYGDFNHPAQQDITKMIVTMCGLGQASLPHGIDGCNVPVIGMEVIQLAFGMARLAQPECLDATMRRHCQRVIAVMQNYPHLLAGSGRICTEINQKTKGEVIVKMGAEGVFSACIPRKGVGIALKIDDGSLKAAEVALVNLLHRLEYLPRDGDFSRWLQPTIKNWNQSPVGEYTAEV